MSELELDIKTDKPRSETRVIVAMSGGVDSSVTAAMLKEAGYDVVGVTLQLYDHGEAVSRPNTCCAGRDIHDARRVAETIGIPHYVLDYEEKFRTQVMDDFADTYLRGETPIPCVKCNETVKFRDLLQQAKDLGGDALVTGHYVRRAIGPDGPELLRGADDVRDQSYFLFTTTREQLDFLHFPLGGMDKDETRELAKKYGLSVASKPDSQDICFVPNGKYSDVVEKLRPGAADPGDIVHVDDEDGEPLGRHDGIIHYTVGQRRGLGIAHPEPLYVVRLDADTKRVVVGTVAATLRDTVRVRDVNWIGSDADPATAHPGEPLRVHVKIRSTTPLTPASVTLNADGSADVVLDEPQSGVAPGQACVMYDGDRLLGGGWIVSAGRVAQAA